MAKKEQSPLQAWEYPAGSSIRIREVINRYQGKDFGVSYRVSIPLKLAGRRILKQFADAEEAEAWAEAEFKALQKRGYKHYEELSSSQQQDARDALDILQELGLNLVDAANFVRKNYRVVDRKITVSDAVKEMLKLKEAENLRPRSIKDLRNRLALFELSFGDEMLSGVATCEIQKWVDELTTVTKDGTSNMSPRSKKNYLVTLKTFFNFAIQKGYRAKEDNPADGVVVPIIDWEVPSILSVAEARKLIEKARKFEGGILTAPIALGLFAGIRTKELEELDWSAIDLEEGTVTIGAKIAKKRGFRLVELSENCIAWLKASPVQSGQLVTHSMRKMIPGLHKAAGFENWREEKSNAMRHSFGTYHYALHRNSALTASALGHKANDQVLFDSYRSLARKKDGEAYFKIKPKR
ncbi:MAG: tyrosine-type recombinase/integrase [Opitutales bacterium]